MWSLPTRGRPSNLKRFVDAYQKTQSTTKIFLRLDEDDDKLEEYLKIKLPETFIVRIGPREGLTAAMNQMFREYPTENFYGLGADDIVPHTLEWDRKLFEICGTKKISYPNDLGKKSKRSLPSHPCCGGDLVRAVGWFANPTSRHYYIDNTWKFVGENLNCIYRAENIIVEHVHYSRKKTDHDVVYQENEKNYFNNDQNIFVDWCETEGKSLIKKLKDKGF